MKQSVFGKYKAQLKDSTRSILGLVLMNAIAQIAVYPLLERELGTAGYGEMQYLMAYINIITVSVGCAANLARMTACEEERVGNNGDYHLFLLAVCVLGIPFSFFIRAFGGVSLNLPTLLCYYLLFVFMAFRYYADVTYKITLQYRRYFCYYLLIGLGYLVGIPLFRITRIWPLAILPGEMAGVLYAYLFCGLLRRRPLRPSPRFRAVTRTILIFCLSEGLSNLIFNADRLLLKWLVGASAVTVYYLATLVGKTMSLVTTPLGGVLIGYLARYNGQFTRRMMFRIFLGSLAAIGVCTGVCFGGGYLMLLWLYPAELNAVMPYLLVGSVSQVLFFITGLLAIILIRFASKICQVYINAGFGLCFFGLGIPATIHFGIIGFAVAMLIASAIRYFIAVLLGFCFAKPAGKAKNADV